MHELTGDLGSRGGEHACGRGPFELRQPEAGPEPAPLAGGARSAFPEWTARSAFPEWTDCAVGPVLRAE